MDKFIRVDSWKPTEKDKILKYDGKLVIIPFDKIFNRGKESINTFLIKKDSYSKRLPELTNYINYFIKFYDTNNELLVSYLKIKYFIDNKKISRVSKGMSDQAFINIIYSVLFTPSMRKNIKMMVEDNYFIDVTDPKNDNKYADSLKFTNEHAKILMCISMSIKIMVPVLFHFLNTHPIRDEDNDSLFVFYDKLFHIFGGRVDIYNKLWYSVNVRTTTSYSINKVIWQQKEFRGINVLEQVDHLLRVKLISETMFKYSFLKNIINLNYVILDTQLKYFRQEKYKKNFIEVSNKKDMNDGLSGVDKLTMSLNKVDESSTITSEININQCIKRIRNGMKVDIDPDELDYYLEYHTISKFQKKLVFNYFAKYFGGFRDLNLLTRKKYILLLVLLKTKLQIQGKKYLPQILTANIEKFNSRTIQNTKFLTKIGTSSVYEALDEKFNAIDQLDKTGTVLNILSTILNTTFTIVDFNRHISLGDELDFNPDVLSNEFLDFLNQI